MINVWTFQGDRLSKGMAIQEFSKILLKQSKLQPGATVEDLEKKVAVHWSAAYGNGVAEIVQDGKQAIETIKGKQRTFWLPSNSVVRLRPEKGDGVTLSISANGSVGIVRGADSEPVDAFPISGDTPAMKAAALRWLAEGETGSSSKTLAHFITGAPEDIDNDPSVPYDGSDFRRCMGFFQAVPEARGHMDKMIPVSDQWAKLVGAWDELEALWSAEHESGKCPGLKAKLDEMLKVAPARSPRP
jgi:hypothetical protein